MRWAPAIVFLAALAALSGNVWNAGVASGYVDPLGLIGAQDEAIYGSEAIAMATGHGWLTQTFLHRWEMSKPPLLMWLTALAFKVAGISRIALRAPTLLGGALVAALLYAVAAGARGTAAGAATAVLAVGNPLLFTLARHGLTDMVVAAATTAAMVIFLGDTAMTRKRTVAGVGVAVAAAILAKSLLGVLPLAVIALASVCVRRGERPAPARLAAAGAVAMAVAAPWFVYQLAVHGEYFLAEMKVIYGQAQGVKPQQTGESALGYYAARLAALDPALAVLAATGLLGLWRALRRREAAAVTVLCWIVTFSVVLLGFRFRSAPYMLPLLPAFLLLAALWSPLFRRRAALPVLAVLIALTGVKAAYGDRPWGLPYTRPKPIASAPALQRYCEMRRGADLILFEPDDQFYAATLPLAHARYAWVDAGGQTFALNAHLHYLGILLSGAEFQTLAAHEGEFRRRMRAWGMRDQEAMGTGIALGSAAELQALVDSRPRSDFLIPAAEAGALHSRAHDAVAADGYVYLLARQGSGEYAPGSGWGCRF